MKYPCVGPVRQNYGIALIVVLFAVILCVPVCPQTALTVARPPVAPVRNVTDAYFGVKVDDPYRYMEDLNNPEVAAWIKAQADYTSQVLDAIPGRAELGKRIKELDESLPERVSNLQVLPGGVFFYEKQLPDQEVPRLYMRKGLTGAETLLVNPESNMAKSGPPMALTYFAVSQDGRYVAYGISPEGLEDVVLHVLDTTMMCETGEAIDRTPFAFPSFLSDGNRFTYSRLQKPGPTSAPADRFLNSVTYLHVIGSSPDTDKPVFGNGVTGVSVAPIDFPSVFAVPGSRYVLGVIGHQDSNEPLICAALEKDLGNPNLTWKQISGVGDHIGAYTLRGNDLYLASYLGGSRFKVLHVSVENQTWLMQT